MTMLMPFLLIIYQFISGLKSGCSWSWMNRRPATWVCCNCNTGYGRRGSNSIQLLNLEKYLLLTREPSVARAVLMRWYMMISLITLSFTFDSSSGIYGGPWNCFGVMMLYAYTVRKLRLRSLFGMYLILWIPVWQGLQYFSHSSDRT